MNVLGHLASRVIRTSLPATAVTTAAVAMCGYLDEGESIAPINSISHILWGDTASRQRYASMQYTACGAALNTIAVASWSLVYEVFFGNRARKGDVSAAFCGGIVVSALAYITDYHVVPKRLTPGFEKRLSPASMLIVYSALAASLPLASLWEHANDSGRARLVGSLKAGRTV